MLSKNITMPPFFWKKLQELANTNTAGHLSRMIALLVEVADYQPATFGIRERSMAERSLPHVNVRFTRHGYSKRKNITMTKDEWRVFQTLANPNTGGAKSTLLRHLITVAYEYAGITLPLNMPHERKRALNKTTKVPDATSRRLKQEAFGRRQPELFP